MNLTKRLLILILFCSSSLKAQDFFENFLEAGADDANEIFEAYLAPGLEGFGFGLNGGWYNTAATHKPFGVDLSFGVNAAFVPSSGEFYNPNNLTLQTSRFTDQNGNPITSDTRFPTVAGSANPTPFIEVTNQETGLTERFEGPTGFEFIEDLPFVALPVPFVQLGIGLIKKTDIKVRYGQDFGAIEDGGADLLGIGIQHDVKQWIPGIKRLPFDASVFIGFTRLTADVADIESDFEERGDPDGLNDIAEFDVNTLTYQLLVSKRLSVFTFYGGFGFYNNNIDLNVLGEYEVFSEEFIDPVTASNCPWYLGRPCSVIV